jgi:hypothetical protein
MLLLSELNFLLLQARPPASAGVLQAKRQTVKASRYLFYKDSQDDETYHKP